MVVSGLQNGTINSQWQDVDDGSKLKAMAPARFKLETYESGVALPPLPLQVSKTVNNFSRTNEILKFFWLNMVLDHKVGYLYLYFLWKSHASQVYFKNAVTDHSFHIDFRQFHVMNLWTPWHSRFHCQSTQAQLTKCSI